MRILSRFMAPATMLLILVVSAAGSASVTAHDAEEVAQTLADIDSAAEAGDAEALYRLYLLYNRGYDTIALDEARATLLLRRAAEAGHPQAQNLLGYRLYRGIGMQRDVSEALQWLENSAIAGNPNASANLGFLLLEGKDVQRDPENAFFWLTRAARAESPTAQSMLGDLYLRGDGVAQDSVRADSLYVRALDNGLTDAAYKLAAMHAGRWEQLPADRQREMGLKFYLSGAPDVGVKLFEMAADRGDAHALALLGDAYTRALGVPYDHQKALDYYARAAAAGDPSAMFIIAELLELLPDSFQSVSAQFQDIFANLPSDAGYWFNEAAKKGIHDASEANRKLLGLDNKTNAKKNTGL